MATGCATDATEDGALGFAGRSRIEGLRAATIPRDGSGMAHRKAMLRTEAAPLPAGAIEPDALADALASEPVAAPVAARAPLDRTRSRPAPTSTVTVPSVSVRSTRAPESCSSATVAGAGWPYGLPRPAEITASAGWTASRNASVDEVRDP